MWVPWHLLGSVKDFAQESGLHPALVLGQQLERGERILSS